MELIRIHKAARIILEAQGMVILNTKTGNKLLEYNGEKVPPESYFLQKPYLVPIYLEKENLEIIELEYSDLRSKFRLIVSSVPINKTNRWFSGQRNKYILSDKYAYRGFALKSLPHDLKIEYDKKHNRIRLKGRNVSETCIGDWVKIHND